MAAHDMNECLDVLAALLDRTTTIDVVQAFREAIGDGGDMGADSSAVAFILDTNAIFHVAKGENADLVLDFLTSRHEGPLVLPSQAVTEFWNNRVREIEVPVEAIERLIGQIEAKLKVLDDLDFSATAVAVRTVLAEFKNENMLVFDPQVRRTVDAAMEQLAGKALVPQVPRGRFSQIAAARNRDKTPPGFKDGSSSDGDFYIWAEGLLAIIEHNCDASQCAVDRAVLVTDDRKKDWSTRGSLHPVLRAEAAAIGVVAECWSVEQLSRYVVNL